MSKIIQFNEISKDFKIWTKKKKGGFLSLFRREKTIINALKNISFEIEEGDIVGYIGPNGAGKSTTIKIMSGILTPTSGECSIMGHTPWKDRQKYVKNIGVVFGQRSQLWWDVPIIDSFELLKDIYKIPKEEYERKQQKADGGQQRRDVVYPLKHLSVKGGSLAVADKSKQTARKPRRRGLSKLACKGIKCVNRAVLTDAVPHLGIVDYIGDQCPGHHRKYAKAEPGHRTYSNVNPHI